MGKKHKGQRFDYYIEVDFQFGYFEIYSKHIETNTVSTITNLNYILSEFANCYNQNDEVEETTWTIKNSIKLEKLWKKANENFTDTDFIQNLEKELDIDRACGGWNSEYYFKNS